MKKYEFQSDPNVVKDYIEQVAEKLPQYDVNIYNVNDFQVLLTEKENCRKCKGLAECKNANYGLFTVYNDDYFSLQECRYRKTEQKRIFEHNLIKTLYLPQKILEATMEDFDQNTGSRKEIFKFVVDFISNYTKDSKKQGLYLYGSFSIGKTYTLACIANELARNNISCLLIYFPDLVVDLKNAINTPQRFEELINMLKSIEVLMLDDLGSENITPWVRDEILGPIINYRVLENKPIFISSNLKPNDLVIHLAITETPSNQIKAERIVSRLKALVQYISMDDGQKYSR